MVGGGVRRTDEKANASRMQAQIPSECQLHDHHTRACRVWPPDGLDAQRRIAAFRPERHEEHLILVTIDRLLQFPLQPRETRLIQRTLEDGELDALPIALAKLRRLVAPLVGGDVVADED